MRKIILIGCVKSKLDYLARARDLYISDLFKKSLCYCLKYYNEQDIYILSAKYGLKHINEMLEPYEETLNNKPRKEIRAWAQGIAGAIRESFTEDDVIYFYAGKKYYQDLIPLLSNECKLPLEGLGIGKRLKFFKEALQ